MLELSGPEFLWVKAFHLIAVISWMAGLFYLPRLYVYHAKEPVGTETSETLKIMERKLLRAIMNPAMVVAVVLGGALLLDLGWEVFAGNWWLQVKVTAGLFMLVFHWQLTRWRRDFAEDRNTRSERFYRVANEIPTVLMIITVIMVIVRP